MWMYVIWGQQSVPDQRWWCSERGCGWRTPRSLLLLLQHHHIQCVYYLYESTSQTRCGPSLSLSEQRSSEAKRAGRLDDRRMNHPDVLSVCVRLQRTTWPRVRLFISRVDVISVMRFAPRINKELWQLSSKRCCGPTIHFMTSVETYLLIANKKTRRAQSACLLLSSVPLYDSWFSSLKQL